MNEKIKTLKIIHFGLCAGLGVSYFIIGDLLHLENLHLPDVTADALIYIAIPIMAIFLSNFLYKLQLKQIDKKKTLDENFAAYQTACIIRWAVIEGAAFMLLFIKPDFIIFGIVLIAFLIFLHPSEDRMRADLTAIR